MSSTVRSPYTKGHLIIKTIYYRLVFCTVFHLKNETTPSVKNCSLNPVVVLFQGVTVLYKLCTPQYLCDKT